MVVVLDKFYVETMQDKEDVENDKGIRHASNH